MRLMRCTAAALALGSLIFATACGSSGEQAGTTKPTTKPTSMKPGATVSMTFTEFDKADYALKTGEALTFVNDNPITHVIVQGAWATGPDGLRTTEKDDGAFSLDIPATKGFTAEHVYDKAGTYQFFCTIHKGMNAAVTVS
jgi:plastocyanin